MKTCNGKVEFTSVLRALLAILAMNHVYGEEAAPGGAEGAATATIEELVSEPCEHKVSIYQCAECRYEVGVVKVDASLLKRAEGGGLIGTQTVARIKVRDALRVTGEVGLNENAAVHISPRVPGIGDPDGFQARAALGLLKFSFRRRQASCALRQRACCIVQTCSQCLE